jgi:hypothetical protein
VLGDIHSASGVECKAFAIAYTSGEAFGGGEALPDPVGIVTPDACSRLEFRARIDSRGGERTVLDLAGIGCRAEIDIQITLLIDCKRMHGVIAGERQPGHDNLGRPRRSNLARR